MNVLGDLDEELGRRTETRDDVFELGREDDDVLFKAAWGLWWGWWGHARGSHVPQLLLGDNLFVDDFTSFAGVALRKDESLWRDALFDCIDIVNVGQ